MNDCKLYINGKQLEQAVKFVYLGRMFTKDWKTDGEILKCSTADWKITGSTLSVVKDKWEWLCLWCCYGLLWYMKMRVRYIRKKSHKSKLNAMEINYIGSEHS